MPSFTTLVQHPGDDDNLAWIKLLLAGLALFALLYEASSEREGNPISLRWKKAAGLVFGVLGVLAYFQFFDIGYKDFYHRHELFHYYVGAKYFPELGYEGIYACTAAAEAELPIGSAGPRDVPARAVRLRKLRDLRKNSIADTTEWVDDPTRCTGGDAGEGRRAFSPERWAAFKADIAFFRRVSFAGPYWNGMQTDHGYNPPPVWGLLGRFFADLHPADVTTMKLLASIDPLLMAATFGMIAWAFGWRVLCVALLFFGTQDASPFYWTGGAFLRQDWLFFTIGSACLLRKGKPFWSGVFLAYGTMLRVFPVFFFAGWIVVAAAHAYRKIVVEKTPLSFSWATLRDLTPPRLRSVAAGAAVGALVLFAATIPVTGLASWRTFVHHIAVHNDTALTNHMGWKTIVSHRAEGRMQITEDPRLADHFQTWKAMRTERKRTSRIALWGGTGLLLGAFVLACWRLKTLWIVEALGCLPATVLIELTDYYYSFFLFAALLSRGRRTVEIALVVASIASEWCHLYYRFFDDRFVAMSVVFLVLAAFLVALHLRPPRWRGATGATVPAR